MVNSYLDGLSPCLAIESATWRWNDSPLQLELKSYLIDAPPPAEYVTSVRAIFVREGRVGVMTNLDGTRHILPGGRVESDEDWLTTLRRELLEEGGWSFSKADLLGVISFRHLTPLPEGYPYPYPDFLQVVYLAQGSAAGDAARKESDYEVDAALVPIEEAHSLPLGTGSKMFLQAAVERLRLVVAKRG
jgi:ADP-ribose pyrophosphatase YjhB (NUDIX family)